MEKLIKNMENLYLVIVNNSNFLRINAKLKHVIGKVLLHGVAAQVRLHF